MEQYQSNSHKAKEARKESAVEKKKIEKVISGTARVKKKGEISKFADMFISEDAANVKSYVLGDVIVPGLKKLAVNIITIAAEMIFGEVSHRDTRSGSSRVPYISYNQAYDRRNDRPYRAEPKAIAGFDYDNIYLESRGDAEYVIGYMQAQIDQYGSASIGDLYDAVGLTTTNFNNQKYGWFNLNGATAVRMFDGSYKLKLPRAVQLD